jgi:hypothetical protein
MGTLQKEAAVPFTIKLFIYQQVNTRRNKNKFLPCVRH